MQLRWTLTWPPPPLLRLPQCRYGIDTRFEHATIMHICPRDGHCQRQSSTVDHKVPFGTELAPIGWILASLFAPPGAGTLALSSAARSQAICPASCRCCKSVRCSRPQVPACCQSRSRRQQVMPLPQPSSWGSISHGMPLFKTKRMPVNAARSAIRGRPPLGLGRSGGKSAARMAQRPSLTNGLLMPFNLPRVVRFC